jgi:hypothetical protein
VFKASAIIDAVASNLDSDLTPAQMADLLLQFKGMKSADLDAATAPGESKYVDALSYVVLDPEKLDAMLERMKKGLPLEPGAVPGSSQPATSTAAATITPGDFQLTIRNGAGVSGLGKECTDFLVSKKFKVSETGNMTQFVYSRTLIVYQKGSEARANLTRETLGFGDVIPSAGMYAFKTPVMVVIGKDWKNPAAKDVRQ